MTFAFTIKQLTFPSIFCSIKSQIKNASAGQTFTFSVVKLFFLLLQEADTEIVIETTTPRHFIRALFCHILNYLESFVRSCFFQ